MFLNFGKKLLILQTKSIIISLRVRRLEPNTRRFPQTLFGAFAFVLGALRRQGRLVRAQNRSKTALREV